MVMNDGTYLTDSYWMHVKTGNIYQILGFSSREEDSMLLVHYEFLTDDKSPVWTRTASEFFDGRFVQCFKPVSG